MQQRAAPSNSPFELGSLGLFTLEVENFTAQNNPLGLSCLEDEDITEKYTTEQMSLWKIKQEKQNRWLPSPTPFPFTEHRGMSLLALTLAHATVKSSLQRHTAKGSCSSMLQKQITYPEITQWLRQRVHLKKCLCVRTASAGSPDPPRSIATTSSSPELLY